MKRKSLKERIAERRALKKKLTAQQNYAFHLDWDELDEDLRRTKIKDYIAHNTDTYGPFKEEDEDSDEMGEAYRDAENSISAHFPIYF